MIKKPAFRPRSVTRAVVTLTIVLSVQACVGRMGRARDPFQEGGGGGEGTQAPLTIEVQNLNFNDATVFALRGGAQTRLGRVTGKTDRVFRISWNFAVPIAFQVDVVGSRGCYVREIPVDPGGRVWVRIPADTGLTPCRSGRR